MSKIPIVIGNHTMNKEEKLTTISLKDYLTYFPDFMTNNKYKEKDVKINLCHKDAKKDTHAIMSSQACFLPIQKGEGTKFNVALYKL